MRSNTNNRHILVGIGVLAMTAGALIACSGDFHSNRGLEDMTCDDTGCFHCSRGDCEEYRCDETHQCPMGRVCTADNHCLPAGASTSVLCDSHDDCADGHICTLDGECVTSPGGGPTKGGDGEADADPDLPDHPDDTCRDNSDCGTDGTCVNGGCYFACATDGRCPPGQACNDSGQCRAAAPENTCTFNGECGTNYACLEGTCYERCDETLDCLSHTRCDTGLCVADITPVLQCSGAGSCDSGLACVDGKCLSPCNTDGSCADGLVCEFGYCARTVECFDQSDCGGLDCINGACPM